MGIKHDYTSCWTTLGPFQRPTGAPYWLKTAPKMALHDQKWPLMTPSGPAWPQMALNHFSWEWYMILCHAGLPSGLFRDSLGPSGPLKRPQGGPLWHIVMCYAPEKCFRAIWSHAGTFWVIKSHFGSWSLFIEASFWAMKGHFGS